MTLNGVILILLVCVATYRVTRLITADHFPPIAKSRQWVDDTFGDEHWLSYLASCPWCVSVYAGAAVTGLTWAYADLPYPLLVWPVASAVTGLIASTEPE